MAKTFFESLQQQMGTTPTAPVGGQQDAAERLLKAKSGKAATGGGIRTSNLGEQGALESTAAASSALAAQGAQQGAGIVAAAAGQEQAATAQLASIDQGEQQAQEKIAFDTEKRKAFTELFQDDLSNKKTILMTKRKGAENRWNSASKFERDLKATILGSARSELVKNLQLDTDLGTMKRQLEERLQAMGFDAVSEAMSRGAARDNRRQMVEGGVGVAQAAYSSGAFDSAPSTNTTTTDNDYSPSETDSPSVRGERYT